MFNKAYRASVSLLAKVLTVLFCSNLIGSIAIGFVPVAHDRLVDEVRKYYVEILEREADPQGLESFSNALAQGVTLGEIRASIAMSPEAAERVRQQYLNVLGREPDAGGLQHFQTLMANGDNVKDVRKLLQRSDEYKAREAMVKASEPIRNMYGFILEREPDPVGLANALDAMARGASKQEIRDGIAYSGEAATKINILFQEILGRQADQGAITHFQAQMAGGKNLQDVRNEISLSPEAAQRRAGAGAAPIVSFIPPIPQIVPSN